MSKNFLTFIFSETTKKQLAEMDDSMRLKFYDILTDYGLYGNEPDNLSSIEKIIWIPMKDLIDNSKSNFQANTENGKKGGRPGMTEELKTQIVSELEAGIPQCKVAEHYQISQAAVSKIKKDYHKPISLSQTPEIIINHNDNDNDNDNENENVNENESAARAEGAESADAPQSPPAAAEGAHTRTLSLQNLRTFCNGVGFAMSQATSEVISERLDAEGLGVAYAKICWAHAVQKYKGNDSAISNVFESALLNPDKYPDWVEEARKKGRSRDSPPTTASLAKRTNAPKKCPSCGAKLGAPFDGGGFVAIKCTCGNWAEYTDGKWDWERKRNPDST